MVSLSAYLNFPKFTVPFCSHNREHPSFHVPSAFVPPHHFPEAIHLERGIQVSQRLLTISGKYVVFPYTPRTVPFIRPSPLCWTPRSVTCTGGVLPYERLMGMYRWMGSHFQQSYQNGSHIFGFFRVRQFFIFTVSKRTRMFVSQMKSKVFFIQCNKWVNS